jgi:methenyltetrahydromethanopterin cyclohydrolase
MTFLMAAIAAMTLTMKAFAGSVDPSADLSEHYTHEQIESIAREDAGEFFKLWHVHFSDSEFTQQSAAAQAHMHNLTSGYVEDCYRNVFWAAVIQLETDQLPEEKITDPNDLADPIALPK